MRSLQGLAPLKSRHRQIDVNGANGMSNSKEVMRYYDTWPGNAVGGTKPELLIHIEKIIAKGLQQVSWEHKTCDGPTKNPFGESIKDAYKDIQPSGIIFSENSNNETSLGYRRDRVNIFMSAACSFASGFKTYRASLVWCMAELRSYERFVTSLLEKAHIALDSRDDAHAVNISDLHETINSLRDEIKIEQKLHKVTIQKIKDTNKKMAEVEEDSKRIQSSNQIIVNESVTVSSANQTLINRIRKLEKRLVAAETNSTANTLIPILEERLREAEKKTSTMRRHAKSCIEENDTLRQKIKVLEQQGGSLQKHPDYITLKDELTKLQNAVVSSRAAQKTPRPDWEQYPDNVIKYDTNTRITTDNLVENILRLRKLQDDDITKFSPFTKLRSSPTQRWITPLGCNSDIPVFLRSTVRIPNQNMSKRSAEFIIREFWRERLSRSTGTLDEAFLQFLIRKFPASPISEAYNVISTVQQYPSDPDCFLFLTCLFGEVTENLVQRQLDLVKILKDEVKNLEDRKSPGIVQKDALLSHLQLTEYGHVMCEALEKDLQTQTGMLCNG